MGVVQRCEIKRHCRFKAGDCPECTEKTKQNGVIVGLIVSALILLSGVGACFLLLSRKWTF